MKISCKTKLTCSYQIFTRSKFIELICFLSTLKISCKKFEELYWDCAPQLSYVVKSKHNFGINIYKRMHLSLFGQSCSQPVTLPSRPSVQDSGAVVMLLWRVWLFFICLSAVVLFWQGWIFYNVGREFSAATVAVSYFIHCITAL